MRNFFLLCLLLPLTAFCQQNDESVDLLAIPQRIEVPVPTINITVPEVYTRWNPRSLDDEIQCLAKNIYFESWKEPEQGQVAVGLVTINRLVQGGWKNTICEIVYQKGKTRIGHKHKIKTVAQFSWTIAWYAKHKPANEQAYQHCIEIAKMLLANGSLFNVPDITQGATYYHAVYVRHLDPGWKDLDKAVKIGLHIFFRGNADTL